LALCVAFFCVLCSTGALYYCYGEGATCKYYSDPSKWYNKQIASDNCNNYLVLTYFIFTLFVYLMFMLQAKEKPVEKDMMADPMVGDEVIIYDQPGQQVEVITEGQAMY